MKVLLTRPAEDSARTAQALAGTGAECLAWPLTRIVPLVGRVEVPPGTEALLFTSANAVRVFADRCAERGLPVFAVGDRTAEAARQVGFRADPGGVTSARGDVRDLARLARATRWRRFLHPRGRESAGDLAGALSDAGLSVEAPVIYAAEPAGDPPTEVVRCFAGGGFDLVTIWSPRHAAILRDWLETEAPPLGGTDLLGISENAVAPLLGAGFRQTAVAERPDAGAMLHWIRSAQQQR